MIRSPLLTLALLLVPSMAYAQTAKPAPMRHMSVTGSPALKQPPVTVQQPAAPQITEKPSAKALKPEQALKKTDSLTEWPYYTDLMTIGNDTALEKVIRAVDIDPGSVPPKGLFYLAKALSDRKRFEEAALYYYAGQLRATFDIARFPPYVLNEETKVSDKRTEDQRGSVPEAEAVLINPHEQISILAIAIGSPISRWAMADPARLEATMSKVREWDLVTPYAYLPDYDISRAAPFETWPALLAKTRSDYFTRVRQISQGLSTVKPVEPTPSFSRP